VIRDVPHVHDEVHGAPRDGSHDAPHDAPHGAPHDVIHALAHHDELLLRDGQPHVLSPPYDVLHGEPLRRDVLHGDLHVLLTLDVQLHGAVHALLLLHDALHDAPHASLHHFYQYPHAHVLELVHSYRQNLLPCVDEHASSLK